MEKGKTPVLLGTSHMVLERDCLQFFIFQDQGNASREDRVLESHFLAARIPIKEEFADLPINIDGRLAKVLTLKFDARLSDRVRAASHEFAEKFKLEPIVKLAGTNLLGAEENRPQSTRPQEPNYSGGGIY